MKQPWQIWTVFGLCLGVVVASMMWLTFKTLEVDALRDEDRVQTEMARREAELQERINSALYRLDWMLTPLIAQEAARPYYLYQPFYRVGTSIDAAKSPPTKSKVNDVDQPSPLLVRPSEFVILHFQINENGEVTSPQKPEGENCQRAITCCGITEDQVNQSGQFLDEVRQFCSYDTIAFRCPQLEINSADADALSSIQTIYLDNDFNRQSAVDNPPDLVMPQSDEPQQFANNDLDSQELYPSRLSQKQQLQSTRNQKRGNREYQQRIQSAQTNAANFWMMNNSVVPDATAGQLVREGVMRPIWINDHLLLARRVSGARTQLVQCCWLNWDRIRDAMEQEVADLLPEVEFEAVRNESDLKFGRALATLPVQLVVDTQPLLASLALDSNRVVEPPESRLKLSLIAAWCGLGLAAMATAFLLHGVVRLSERRAAFVSAVTHELRTPLTTFRMYAEMLAEQMVPPEKQQRYAETLKQQADRLSNLVENVLQFARLERGADERRLEEISVRELTDGFYDRLSSRAEQADMELIWNCQACDQDRLNTDPDKVEQILFNLVDNACKYARSGSDRRIELGCYRDRGNIQFTVQDFGPGVAPKFRRTLFQAFCKSDLDAANSAPGVGLGLALCRRMAHSIGGKIWLAPSDQGARFVLELPA